jgi:hypothetical protein
MSQTFSSRSKERFSQVLLCQGRGLLVEHADATKTFALGAYIVTNLGKQVIRLGKFAPNESYLAAVGQTIQKQTFKVSLIDYTDAGNGMIRYFNAKAIPDATQTEGGNTPPLSE